MNLKSFAVSMYHGKSFSLKYNPKYLRALVMIVCFVVAFLKEKRGTKV